MKKISLVLAILVFGFVMFALGNGLQGTNENIVAEMPEMKSVVIKGENMEIKDGATTTNIIFSSQPKVQYCTHFPSDNNFYGWECTPRYKRYRLIKDLPVIKAGTEFEWDYSWGKFYSVECGTIAGHCRGFGVEAMKPDYFEPITE